jgi:nicotinamide mononucleotide transporter
MHYLGWVGIVFVLVGYYLMAKKDISAWCLWFIGNIFIGLYSYAIGAWPTAILSVVLAVMNIYGFFSWKKEKKD